MKTYVINRQDRPDRLHDVRIELENQGLNAHRFEAIIDKIGYKGCTKSHLAIMEQCQNNSQYLILEDDAEFLHPKTTTELILKGALEQLPSDWDALFLGCSPQEPQERYSNNLFRLRKAKTSHAILWHNRPNGAVQYILSHKHDIKKWDRYLYEVIMPKFQVYCTYPMLITQKQSASNVSKRSDCSTILKNFNKYCI
jgi:GR25 family glycosyltransferase involved in LPS biosynthesis